MKTVQQMPTSFDRISTHEELHQVLALVGESVPSLANEASNEADERKALQVAVADLWRDTALNEHDRHNHDRHNAAYDEDGDVRDQMYQWAEMLAGRTARIN